MLRFSALEDITGGRLLQLFKDEVVTDLIVDSRKPHMTEGAIFFAIRGANHDGHQFLADLYQAGVRQFVVEKEILTAQFKGGNFLLVPSSLTALQRIVSHHRQQFTIPVIGVTGSNGKTIIKEWLYQLLSPEYNVVKNPGSYNSQLGVALAVWQMQERHTLGIFEAGISRPEEMQRLQKIIQPTIGLFTNLGTAHDEGFKDRRQKLNEKLELFGTAGSVIYCSDQPEVSTAIKKNFGKKAVSWGSKPGADMIILHDGIEGFSVSLEKEKFHVTFPFLDEASVQNAGHCIAMMIHLGYEKRIIRTRIPQLKTVPMRLELKQGINYCQLIDDSYNNDLVGMQISLNFLSGLQKEKKTLILSDIAQSGMSGDELTTEIAETVKAAHLSRFIGIGPLLYEHRKRIENIVPSQFFISTNDFLNALRQTTFQDEAILIKGARSFQFEKIVARLQKKIHGTVMEIDLSALIHNLNFIRSKLKPSVKLMVMVKAFAYGSGSEEVASLLQYHKVDYLGVAYTDEGVELRKNHIQLPIMVMNVTEESFDTLLQHNLEPEIYSTALLRALALFQKGRHCRVHLKIDTGMRRLGLEDDDVNEAIECLKQHKNIEVVSIFSHLAGADDASHDAFSREQADRFLTIVGKFRTALLIDPILHVLNSPGILRFPELQMNMVRLGIGLYGIDPTGGKNKELFPVATLKTIISQIKKVKAGETVGYGRSGRPKKDTTIATIAIGYADGFNRAFSKGVGSVLIHGKQAAVIGNVCMDMTMVDITGINAKEGDEVIVFGNELPIEELAKRINTIPYEILTSTSERVKRVFFAESI